MADLRCTLAGTHGGKQYMVEVSGDIENRFNEIRLKLGFQTGRLLSLIAKQCGGQLTEDIVNAAVVFTDAITVNLELPRIAKTFVFDEPGFIMELHHKPLQP